MTKKSKVTPLQMRSNSIPQDRSPIQEEDSPVKQWVPVIKQAIKWGSKLFTKAPKKEIIKKGGKVKKPKVKTKKVDTKKVDTQTKKVDTKKVDTKKVDTKKVDTKKHPYDDKRTAEYKALEKGIMDKMKTLSPEKKTIAQNAWKWIKRGGTAYLTYDIATYFLSQMGGEEVENKKPGDKSDLIYFNPYAGDSTNLEKDLAGDDEFISVEEE